MKLAGFEVGAKAPLFLIAGPCVIESEELVLTTAERLKSITAKLEMPLVFKASFDKANRSSPASFRGLGVERGLRILERVRLELGLPVLTDVHEDTPLDEVAAVVDVLQTPALLCRQTDFIVAVASHGKPVNLKKGQFLAPWEMTNVVAKARSTGNESLLVCERGVSFGYNNLVVDPRSFPMLRALGYPVVFDVTHSLQLPGAGDGVTAGLAEYIEPMAQAGVAAGVDGVFLEVHEEPSRAKSDAANALKLDRLEPLLRRLVALDKIVRNA